MNRRNAYIGMCWDEGPLQCGYVVDRLPRGEWWHLHFGRAAIAYRCELLNARTNVFACLQHFARGALVLLPQFVLTLDGEGVELPIAELGLNFRWGLSDENSGLPAEAARFQTEVVPRLHESQVFQRAIAEIVRHQRFARVIDRAKLMRE